MLGVTVPNILQLNYCKLRLSSCASKSLWGFVKVFPGVPGAVWAWSRVFNCQPNSSSARMICFMYLLPCKISLE